MSTVDLGTFAVCQCCMLVAANGECCAEEHEHEPLGMMRPGDHVALGGEHRDGCTERDVDCDCGDLGFSWSQCDGCESPLGGDRFAVSVFRVEA